MYSKALCNKDWNSALIKVSLESMIPSSGASIEEFAGRFKTP
jgi:hypothetical protein